MRSVSVALLLAAAVLLSTVMPAAAQLGGFPCPGSYPPLVGKAHEQLTISTVAKTLTQAVYMVSGQGPLAAQITVISAAINAIDDGTTATAAIGQVVSPGTTFWACGGHSVGALSMIRNGGSDATANIIYYYAP